MAKELPFSPATERNKTPILAVLRDVFDGPQTILEIGSGTGQHAIYFAQELPHLRWIASETPGRQATLKPRLTDTALENIDKPRVLDVTDEDWPVSAVDGVFAANVAHIMGWPQVQALFAGVGKVLIPDGAFCLYGPFNYRGEFTSDSNRAFDADLRGRDSAMGLRDLADLEALADAAGMRLEQDFEMPANNRLLLWRRAAAG